MNTSDCPADLCAPYHRRPAAPLVGSHTRHPSRPAQHALDHRRVQIHRAVLQRVQGYRGRLLLLQPIGDDLAAAAINAEVVGRVSVLDHVRPLMDSAPGSHSLQIAAQDSHTERRAQFDQSLVGWVLQVGAHEASQGVCRSSVEPECGHIPYDLSINDARPSDAEMRQRQGARSWAGGTGAGPTAAVSHRRASGRFRAFAVLQAY